MHTAILISQANKSANFEENLTPKKADQLAFSWNQPFEEQIEFFKQKGFAYSPDSWRDVWKDAHSRAFTVARVTAMDVLVDIRKEVDAAQKGDMSPKEFKENLIPILTRKGWFAPEGEKAIVEMPDGTERKRLTAARLDNIWKTNISAAKNVGRFKQIQDLSRIRPWLRYVAVIDSATRDEHEKLNDTIKRVDDKFWDRFYPPNGFQCRCDVESLSDDDMKRMGLKETSDSNLPDVEPHEGFDYHIGKSGLDSWKPDMLDFPEELRKIVAKEPEPEPAPEPIKKKKPIKRTAKEVREKFLEASEEISVEIAELKTDIDENRIRTTQIMKDRLALTDLRNQGKITQDDFLKKVAPLNKEDNKLYREREELNTEIDMLKEDLTYEFKKAIGQGTGSIKADTKALDRNRKNIVNNALDWYQSIMDIEVQKISAEKTRRVRAYASKRYRSINLPKGTSIETAIHEIGHLIEDGDQRILNLAKAFLESRTRGESPRRMNDVVKWGGYRSDEMTKPDKFFNPYCGKIYKDSTEILSMGFEKLYEDPFDLADTDPDYFDFLIDILKGNF